MRIDIFSLFPSMFAGPFESSIIKRAIDQNIVNINIHNIRDYTHDKHHTADDYAYGGGAGMVLKPEPVFEAVDRIKAEGECVRIILMSPQGEVFNHKKALELSREKCKLVLICGRYEGIDERVRLSLVDEEISIGDFVLSGGEMAAAVVIEAAARLVPGVLGTDESAELDSFYDGLLDYPHYTRPAQYRDMPVPDVLLSGNHAEIRRWRRKEALKATMRKRPDLLEKVELGPEDKKLMGELEAEMWEG